MAFRFPTEKIFPPEDRWQIIKSWLRSIFLEDWVTKSIALLITFALWYGVTGRYPPITERKRGVPLSFRLPSGTEISNEPIKDVEITVTGDRGKLARLNAQDLTVDVDLTDYKPGELVVQLKPETVNLQLPNGIRLDAIEPNKIALRMEPQIEKAIDVKPNFSGQPADGFELYNAIVIPARVRVRGAASQVNALNRLLTEEIKLDGRSESLTEHQVTVDLPDDSKITVLDAVVDVNIQIGEQRIEKSFAGVQVHEISGAKPSPETATVTLYGIRSALENLRTENLLIQLEINADGSISHRLVLPPELEGKVQERSIKPNGFSIVK